MLAFFIFILSIFKISYLDLGYKHIHVKSALGVEKKTEISLQFVLFDFNICFQAILWEAIYTMYIL